MHGADMHYRCVILRLKLPAGMEDTPNRMLSLPIAEAIDHAGGKFELAHFDVDLACGRVEFYSVDRGVWRIHGSEFQYHVLDVSILEFTR